MTSHMNWITGIWPFLVAGVTGVFLGLGSRTQADVPASSKSYVAAVAVDTKGQLIWADSSARGLFRLTNGTKEQFTKTSGKPRTPLYGLRAVIPDSQDAFLVSDPATCEVYRVTADGSMTGLTHGALNQPFGLAVTPKGEIFVADLGEKAIFQIVDGKAAKYAEVDNPTGLTVDKDGSLIVVSRGTNNLYRISAGRKITTVLPGRKLSFPHSVVVESSGDYLVSDGYGRSIWRVTPKGEPRIWIRSELFKSPQGLALERNGNLLVADPQAQSIFRVTPDGKITVAIQP